MSARLVDALAAAEEAWGDEGPRWQEAATTAIAVALEELPYNPDDETLLDALEAAAASEGLGDDEVHNMHLEEALNAIMLRIMGVL